MFAQHFLFKAPDDLLERLAGRPPARVVIAGSDHELPMQAAAEATRRGLIEPILVGNRDETLRIGRALDWALDGVEIVNADDPQTVIAKSVDIIKSGGGDILAKGHVDTSSLMSAVLSGGSGLRTERRLTHAFYLTSPTWTRALTISDAALNVAPDLDAKREIALNAIALAQATGVRRPKVAILSGTEKPSEKMPSSVEADRLAREIAANPEIECEIAGPLAMDLAISPEAGQVKGLSGPVVGHADVVIVPTLEAGNILYKTLVYACGATAAGLVMGARIPIVLTSRADPPSARLTSFALAVLVAEHEAIAAESTQ